MEEELVANENITLRINVDSDICVASGILTRGELDLPSFRLGGEEAYYNLYVYCYAAQLLKVGSGEIATTGALVFDPAGGTVNAEIIVVSASSRKPGQTNRKDAKWEWDCKDLEANEDLGVDGHGIRNLR
jgi:hypothetical protein